jgi:hypothetical protein
LDAFAQSLIDFDESNNMIIKYYTLIKNNKIYASFNEIDATSLLVKSALISNALNTSGTFVKTVDASLNLIEYNQILNDISTNGIIRVLQVNAINLINIKQFVNNPTAISLYIELPQNKKILLYTFIVAINNYELLWKKNDILYRYGNYSSKIINSMTWPTVVSVNQLIFSNNNNILASYEYESDLSSIYSNLSFPTGASGTSLINYDYSGKVISNVKIDSPDPSGSEIIAVNLIINGYIYTFGNNTSKLYDLTEETINTTNGFIAKYDFSGSLIWSKSIGVIGQMDRTTSVVYYNSKIYLALYSSSGIPLYSGQPIPGLTTSINNKGYVISINEDGSINTNFTPIILNNPTSSTLIKSINIINNVLYILAYFSIGSQSTYTVINAYDLSTNNLLWSKEIKINIAFPISIDLAPENIILHNNYLFFPLNLRIKSYQNTPVSQLYYNNSMVYIFNEAINNVSTYAYIMQIDLSGNFKNVINEFGSASANTICSQIIEFDNYLLYSIRTNNKDYLNYYSYIQFQDIYSIYKQDRVINNKELDYIKMNDTNIVFDTSYNDFIYSMTSINNKLCVFGVFNDIQELIVFEKNTSPFPMNPIIETSILQTKFLNYFPALSKILLANQQEKLVKDLSNNDLIYTTEGRSLPITITQIPTLTDISSAPYLITPEIRRNPLQALQINQGIWKFPADLSAQQYDLASNITYYDIRTPNYYRDLLVADSNAVESTSDTTALVYDDILKAYVRPIRFDKYTGQS